MTGSLEQYRYIVPGEEATFTSLAAYYDEIWIAALGRFCRRTGLGRVTGTCVSGDWQTDLGWWLMVLRVELAEGPFDLAGLRAAVNAERLPELAQTAAPPTQAAAHRGAA